MKRKLNSKSSIYTFLKSSGVLMSGTPDEIRNARIIYWREYKRNWRKLKRRAEKEITLCLTADELQVITKEAKRHKISKTRFIKQACLAYLNKSFIVPDLKEVKKISQILAMSYNFIQEMTEENKMDFKSGKSILESIYRLEREILPVLNNPKSLEVLIKEHIEKNAKNKNSLVEFINSI